jgi:hypothetical protein
VVTHPHDESLRFGGRGYGSPAINGLPFSILADEAKGEVGSEFALGTKAKHRLDRSADALEK